MSIQEIDLDALDQQPLDTDAMAKTRNQLVCIFPEGLGLSEESWALIVAEWRRRRDRGEAEPMLSADEVIAVVNRGPR